MRISLARLTEPRSVDQLARELTDCLPCQLRQDAEAAARRRFSADSQTGVPTPDGPPSPVTWHGVLIQENVMTGDGRFIEPNALRWGDLPMPLRWVRVDTGGHENAVVVGRILTIDRAGDGDITATGDFDMDSEDGQEAARQVDKGLQPGVSADVDDLTFEIRVAKELVDEAQQPPTEIIEVQAADADGRVTVAEVGANDEVRVLTDGRIRAATLVPIPAFAGARIALDQPLQLQDEPQTENESEGITPDGEGCSCDENAEDYDPDCDCGNALPPSDEEEGMTASVIGAADLPVAARDQTWDAAAARSRIFDRYTNAAGDLDSGAVSQAFIWRRPGEDPSLRGSYAGPYADIINDRLQIVPAGVAALAGSRGVNAIGGVSAEDRARLQSRVCTLYGRVRSRFDDWPDCPFDTSGSSSATVTAAGGPLAPPADWFTNPQLPGPTGITVTAAGRIFGHLAVWGSCHTGYPGQCITPPNSASGYAYFRTGTVLCADGTEVPVGRITMDTLHAAKTLGAADTLAHYEHTGRAVADVAAGEDGSGIWVAGAIRPGLTAEQLRALRSSPLSGDWRRIGTGLELVAALAVNVPGFPVPRPAGMVASGRMCTLVASGMIAPNTPTEVAGLSASDLAFLKHLAQRERQELVASAAVINADRGERVRREARRLAAAVLADQIRP